MRPARLALLAEVLFVAALSPTNPAFGQNGFPFELVVQQTSSATVIPNGATINIPAQSVGTPVQLSLVVTNTGQTSATFGGPKLVGDTTDFSVTASSLLPSVPPGQSETFAIVFTPSVVNAVSALVNISFAVAPATAGGASSTGFITVDLVGTAPGYLLSYIAPPLSNAIALSNNGTVQFPSTPVGGSSTAILAITNNGTAPGPVNAITISGAAFQTQGLPLLPGNIASGQTLQVSIVYRPSGAQTDVGILTISLPSQTITINLAVTPSQFQYTVTQGGQTTTLGPSQAIAVANTSVGGSSIVSLTVTNASSSAATIGNITVTGQGFLLSASPVVPLTLQANASTSLAFTFAPQQAGNFSGTLQVGNDSFAITGKGLAPAYTYSYTAGSATATVIAGGSLFFPPTQVGQSTTTTFTITNGGTTSGTISSIFIGEGNSPYSLSSLPPLPVTVAPTQSISFQITFTPVTTAIAAGTLHLDGAQFVLAGPGNSPPPLPSFSFSGASGIQQPLQQPTVGLSLAAPYSLPISGTLTMTVASDGISADPAIQFATGGRTASFTIAPNTLSAVFANGSSTLGLQTGSTAGTITLTPSFQTAGGAQLTPANPATLQFTVPQTAPILTAVQVVAQTANGVTLAVSGVSDSQALTHVDFTFTPAPNFNLSGSTVSVPVSSAATAWFQSAAAQQFGGQFTVTVPFTLTTSATKTPLSAIASISATATNTQGTSAPVSLKLQ